jgi:hypothetical protein
MVHIFRKKSKIDLDFLDFIAKNRKWDIEKEGDGRTYTRGEQKIKLMKISDGFKVILFRKDYPIDTDASKYKNMIYVLTGEALAFRTW